MIPDTRFGEIIKKFIVLYNSSDFGINPVPIDQTGS